MRLWRRDIRPSKSCAAHCWGTIRRFCRRGRRELVGLSRGLMLSMILRLLLALASLAPAQVLVRTAQYDNARTGANLRETILTPRNVNPAQFGKLVSVPVDGDVYAQPLYVPKLEVPGKG